MQEQFTEAKCQIPFGLDGSVLDSLKPKAFSKVSLKLFEILANFEAPSTLTVLNAFKETSN